MFPSFYSYLPFASKQRVDMIKFGCIILDATYYNLPYNVLLTVEFRTLFWCVYLCTGVTVYVLVYDNVAVLPRLTLFVFRNFKHVN